MDVLLEPPDWIPEAVASGKLLEVFFALPSSFVESITLFCNAVLKKKNVDFTNIDVSQSVQKLKSSRILEQWLSLASRDVNQIALQIVWFVDSLLDELVMFLEDPALKRFSPVQAKLVALQQQYTSVEEANKHWWRHFKLPRDVTVALLVIAHYKDDQRTHTTLDLSEASRQDLAPLNFWNSDGFDKKCVDYVLSMFKFLNDVNHHQSNESWFLPAHLQHAGKLFGNIERFFTLQRLTTDIKTQVFGDTTESVESSLQSAWMIFKRFQDALRHTVSTELLKGEPNTNSDYMNSLQFLKIPCFQACPLPSKSNLDPAYVVELLLDHLQACGFRKKMGLTQKQIMQEDHGFVLLKENPVKKFIHNSFDEMSPRCETIVKGVQNFSSTDPFPKHQNITGQYTIQDLCLKLFSEDCYSEVQKWLHNRGPDTIRKIWLEVYNSYSKKFPAVRPIRAYLFNDAMVMPTPMGWLNPPKPNNADHIEFCNSSDPFSAGFSNFYTTTGRQGIRHWSRILLVVCPARLPKIYLSAFSDFHQVPDKFALSQSSFSIQGMQCKEQSFEASLPQMVGRYTTHQLASYVTRSAAIQIVASIEQRPELACFLSLPPLAMRSDPTALDVNLLEATLFMLLRAPAEMQSLTPLRDDLLRASLRLTGDSATWGFCPVEEEPSDSDQAVQDWATAASAEIEEGTELRSDLFDLVQNGGGLQAAFAHCFKLWYNDAISLLTFCEQLAILSPFLAKIGHVDQPHSFRCCGYLLQSQVLGYLGGGTMSCTPQVIVTCDARETITPVWTGQDCSLDPYNFDRLNLDESLRNSAATLQHNLDLARAQRMLSCEVVIRCEGHCVSVRKRADVGEQNVVDCDIMAGSLRDKDIDTVELAKHKAKINPMFRDKKYATPWLAFEHRFFLRNGYYPEEHITKLFPFFDRQGMWAVDQNGSGFRIDEGFLDETQKWQDMEASTEYWDPRVLVNFWRSTRPPDIRTFESLYSFEIINRPAYRKLSLTNLHKDAGLMTFFRAEGRMRSRAPVCGRGDNKSKLWGNIMPVVNYPSALLAEMLYTPATVGMYYIGEENRGWILNNFENFDLGKWPRDAVPHVQFTNHSFFTPRDVNTHSDRTHFDNLFKPGVLVGNRFDQSKTGVLPAFCQQGRHHVGLPNFQFFYNPMIEQIFRTQITGSFNEEESFVYSFCSAAMANLNLGLRNAHNWQLATLIRGSAGCGKSVLTEWISKFFPQDKVANIMYLNSRFGMSMLRSKMLILMPEAPIETTRNAKEESMQPAQFKQLVTGETTSGEVKNGGMVQFCANAGFCMCANGMPTSLMEPDEGVLRRLLIIFMSQVPSIDDRKNGNVDELADHTFGCIAACHMAFNNLFFRNKGESPTRHVGHDINGDYVAQGVAHPLFCTRSMEQFLSDARKTPAWLKKFKSQPDVIEDVVQNSSRFDKWFNVIHDKMDYSEADNNCQTAIAYMILTVAADKTTNMPALNVLLNTQSGYFKSVRGQPDDCNTFDLKQLQGYRQGFVKANDSYHVDTSDLYKDLLKFIEDCRIEEPINPWVGMHNEDPINKVRQSIWNCWTRPDNQSVFENLKEWLNCAMKWSHPRSSDVFNPFAYGSDIHKIIFKFLTQTFVTFDHLAHYAVQNSDDNSEIGIEQTYRLLSSDPSVVRFSKIGSADTAGFVVTRWRLKPSQLDLPNDPSTPFT